MQNKTISQAVDQLANDQMEQAEIIHQSQETILQTFVATYLITTQILEKFEPIERVPS